MGQSEHKSVIISDSFSYIFELTMRVVHMHISEIRAIRGNSNPHTSTAALPSVCLILSV